MYINFGVHSQSCNMTHLISMDCNSIWGLLTLQMVIYSPVLVPTYIIDLLGYSISQNSFLFLQLFLTGLTFFIECMVGKCPVKKLSFLKNIEVGSCPAVVHSCLRICLEPKCFSDGICPCMG